MLPCQIGHLLATSHFEVVILSKLLLLLLMHVTLSSLGLSTALYSTVSSW